MLTPVISFPFSDSDQLQLIDALQTGKVMIFATETFYALGCNALDSQAVHRIFQIKKREFSKSLPLLISSKMARDIQKSLSKRGRALTSKFWAGAMTLVLPAPQWIPLFLHAPDSSIAVRHSDSETVSALLDLVECPLIGTSANFSNESPHANLQSIPDSFKQQVDLMIDSGKTTGGTSSTIVSMMQEPPIILREGKHTKEIQTFLKFQQQ